MSDSIEDILTRRVVEILPDRQTLKQKMQNSKIRVYLGVDPTGSFLHLGHAIALKKLNEFAQNGHEAILLIGTGTVKIGDPTGRDKSRPELTEEQIQENFKNWKKQAQKILDFSKIKIKYNGDWLDKLTMPQIIKLMAKTTVQQLLERDMFQKRIENNLPIFGHEIMYPMLQGYDSVAMDVDLEIGGTDQTFNMLMGRHLQKIYNNKEKWILTVPLLVGLDGRKMSKSFNNFIGLTEDPKNIFAKVMRLQDELIIDYFDIVTDIQKKKIQEYKKRLESGENPMIIKKILAFEITKMLSSEQEAEQAQDFFETAFNKKQIPDDIPTVIVNKADTILDIVKKALPNLSNSDIKRLIKQNAVKDLTEQETIKDFKQTKDKDFVLKVGKKYFFNIKYDK